MKVIIIEQDISFVITYDEPCEDGRETDTAIEIQEICSSYAVRFKFSSTSTEDRFTILKQELFLDEQEMTGLFADVLVWADYDICYSLYDDYDESEEYSLSPPQYDEAAVDVYAFSLTPKTKNNLTKP